MYTLTVITAYTSLLIILVVEALECLHHAAAWRIFTETHCGNSPSCCVMSVGCKSSQMRM